MPKLIEKFTMWFPLPDDPLKGEIEIIHLTDGEQQDIILEATENRTTFTEDGPIKQSGHNVLKDVHLTLCRAINDWKNFFGLEGEDLPCTDANKMDFARDVQFRRFVTDCRKKTKEAFDAEQEAKTKNSQALPPGSQESDGKAATNAETPTNPPT